MKIASVAEVKAKFSAFLKASEEGAVIVTRNGRPVVVIVGVQDEEEIERLVMACSPRLRAILDRSRQQIQEGQGRDHETFWAEVGESEAPKGPSKARRKKA